MENDSPIRAALMVLAVSLAGCATVAEKNTDECEAVMKAFAEPALVSVSQKQLSPSGSAITLSGVVEIPGTNSVLPAKAECRFDDKSLAAFHWLAPTGFGAGH